MIFVRARLPQRARQDRPARADALAPDARRRALHAQRRAQRGDRFRMLAFTPAGTGAGGAARRSSRPARRWRFSRPHQGQPAARLPFRPRRAPRRPRSPGRPRRSPAGSSCESESESASRTSGRSSTPAIPTPADDHPCDSLLTRILLALALALTAWLAAPAAASAFTIGMSDQKVGMWQDPRFQQLGIRHVRLLMSYDSVLRGDFSRYDQWMAAAAHPRRRRPADDQPPLAPRRAAADARASTGAPCGSCASATRG